MFRWTFSARQRARFMCCATSGIDHPGARCQSPDQVTFRASGTVWYEMLPQAIRAFVISVVELLRPMLSDADLLDWLVYAPIFSLRTSCAQDHHEHHRHDPDSTALVHWTLDAMGSLRMQHGTKPVLCSGSHDDAFRSRSRSSHQPTRSYTDRDSIVEFSKAVPVESTALVLQDRSERTGALLESIRRS